MAYTGAIVAASGAADKRRQMLSAEEEDMTEYTQDDLKNDWEFKIVHSDSGAFRKPGVLQKLVEEEAQAGWVMLEKFDDSRVRFKRSHSARARDDFLEDGVDPYRTRYGASPARQSVLMFVLAGLVALGLVAYLQVRGTGGSVGSAESLTMMPLILIVLGVFLVVWKARRMR